MNYIIDHNSETMLVTILTCCKVMALEISVHPTYLGSVIIYHFPGFFGLPEGRDPSVILTLLVHG